MKNLNKEMENLKEAEFPQGLHGKIMRRVAILRFRMSAFVITSLLAVNLVITGWRVWARIGEADSISIIKATLDSFEFSSDFFSSLWNSITNSVPIWYIAVFLINSMLLGYILFLVKQFRKMEFIKGRYAQETI